MPSQAFGHLTLIRKEHLRGQLSELETVGVLPLSLVEVQERSDHRPCSCAQLGGARLVPPDQHRMELGGNDGIGHAIEALRP